VGVFAATLTLAVALLMVLVVRLAVVGFGSFMDYAFTGEVNETRGGHLVAVGVLLLAVILVGGSWAAWRVATGGWAAAGDGGPPHQIPAGGLSAWTSWKGRKDEGGESVNLPERLPVRFRESRGVWAKVTAEDGTGGWVVERLLVPMADTALDEPPPPPA